jgi:hypothetical protein
MLDKSIKNCVCVSNCGENVNYAEHFPWYITLSNKYNLLVMPSLFLLWNSYKEPRLELGVDTVVAHLPITEAFL